MKKPLILSAILALTSASSFAAKEIVCVNKAQSKLTIERLKPSPNNPIRFQMSAEDGITTEYVGEISDIAVPNPANKNEITAGDGNYWATLNVYTDGFFEMKKDSTTKGLFTVQYDDQVQSKTKHKVDCTVTK